MKYWLPLALGFVLAWAFQGTWHAFSATTLLPNGKQCFTIGGGVPAVNGSVNMYTVNTTTAKTTWQDSAQGTQNSNPIQLDANGCAIIYGVGSYRQQLFDGPVVAGLTTGTLIWDQVTTDTSAFNSTFWAATSGGTANVITVVDSGFNGTDGTIINFVALNTNTSAATLNPSSFGAIPIVKDTASGPVALTGGEIVAGNTISVLYQASGNSFHIQNLVAAASATTQTPLCGAVNLVLVNDSVAPNSTMDITADQVLMQTAGGAFITRNNVSVTINLTLSNVANGLDGRDTFTASTFYNAFIIDNGIAPAGLGSNITHGSSPQFPSGYSYKCRIGAFSTGADGNLRRTRQNGSTSEPVVTAGTNTLSFPIMARGIQGTYSSTSPTYATLTVSSFVPSTAQRICVLLNSITNSASIVAAPNGVFGGTTSAEPPPCWVGNSVFSTNIAASSNACWFNLQNSAQISIASSAADGVIQMCGWKDSVNAN